MMRRVDHRGLGDAVALARSGGLPVAICSSPVTNKTELIEEILRAVSARSTSGRNWDALADVLSDHRGLLCLPDLSGLEQSDVATLESVIDSAASTNDALVVTAPS